jgi:hypothetical protein
MVAPAPDRHYVVDRLFDSLKFGRQDRSRARPSYRGLVYRFDRPRAASLNYCTSADPICYRGVDVEDGGAVSLLSAEELLYSTLLYPHSSSSSNVQYYIDLCEICIHLQRCNEEEAGRSERG